MEKIGIDVHKVSRCGGRLRFIATITEQPVITKILDALGLPSQPPLPHARAPDPQLGLDPVMHVASRDFDGRLAARTRGNASVCPHAARLIVIPLSLSCLDP